MAAELRLILLGLGIALVVGLWWWERRRPGAPREESGIRTSERFEPRLEADSHSALRGAMSAAPAPRQPDLGDTRELPALRATAAERPVPRGDPPLVTIEDLPEDPTDVVLATPTSSAVSPAAVALQEPEPAVQEAPRLGTAAAEVRRAEPSPSPATPALAPTSATETDHTSTQPKLPETPPRHQRIVAIRLLARDRQRIEGRDLKAALSSESLEFGRYSIYHRSLDGGRPLYSVASLLEPGSFDPEQMESVRFPGISLFAVFPGPLPAPQCFDDMLATARRLADRLQGTLHDDSGSTLTGQRVLSIREDLVHFEHLVALSRTRPQA
ncbi:MAG TPA: cell division protein ZipA C-terminal FtsZ-binding domain-containing protein [Steroidobacteraceae bacterium]|nr:cell division protein ZipA C-terminal FtsZ-binding domain-containing protein [Steroidobacteraceae bacterium]